MNRVKEIAQKYGVSIRITYYESEDNWYGEVISAAKSENIEIKKICRFDDLIDYIEDHLKND